MEYVRRGSTGMQVSRICLGCMGFGDAEHWVHKWVLNEEYGRPVIQKALELGINFFDRANYFSPSLIEESLPRRGEFRPRTFAGDPGGPFGVIAFFLERNQPHPRQSGKRRKVRKDERSPADRAVLAALPALLAPQPDLDVVGIIAMAASEQTLCALRPNVIIFDLGAVQPAFHYALVEHVPGLILVGIDASTNRVLVWSGPQVQELSTI